MQAANGALRVSFTLPQSCIKLLAARGKRANNASKRGGKAEEAKQLKTTRDECEIQFIMQTMLESYNSTMCEHNAVF